MLIAPPFWEEEARFLMNTQLMMAVSLDVLDMPPPV
jgi:hypothetical protein